MCTSVSKPSMGITNTPPNTMSMLQASSMVQWPCPTTEADRARIRKAQVVWNGAGNHGKTRTDDVQRVEPEVPCAASREARASTSSNSGSSTMSEPEDLQHPAARALQILGYPCDDITKAVRLLKQRAESICAERLLDLVMEPEENRLDSTETLVIEEDCGPESGSESEGEKPISSNTETEENAQQVDSGVVGSVGISEDGSMSEGLSAIDNDVAENKDTCAKENSPRSPKPSPGEKYISIDTRKRSIEDCRICVSKQVL